MTTNSTILLLLAAAAVLAAALHCPAIVTAAADDEPCDPSDIHITTDKTGKVVGGKPEYQVTISNECSCPEGDVVVSCLDGVPSGVDPSKIHVAGKDSGLCLVNNGLQIVKGSPVVFTYVASQPIFLEFNTASPRCNR
uniref:LGC1 n=1 Tax=Leersia perrieri TaxID=77586 RepID=A0A0D9XQF7_9ORYZ